MTTRPDSGKHEILYDFFNPDLWLARVDGMVWLLRMTYDAIEGTLGTLDGISVRTCTRLLQSIGVGNFEPLVDQIESGAEGAQYAHLMAQIKEAQGNAGVGISLLAGYLVGLIDKDGVPLSAEAPEWAVDFDFEMKQLINLRTLCLMYIYFFTDMRVLIKESLATHKEAQTHPPLHVIQACYRRLANDFEILQRAVLQRQPFMDAQGKRAAGVLAQELVMTDKLALRALAPFAHLLSNPNILTFFSQDTHIRSLPFSDLYIVVGLSHGRISPTYNQHHRLGGDGADQKPLPALELLAIPHEIGHYLYDHARLPADDVTQGASQLGRFADLRHLFTDNPYHHWCEELFADLYGCIVAGPIAVLGMQALLAASDAESMWANDGKHPTPLIRPFIQSEMLRVLALCAPARYAFSQAAESLDANWAAVLQRWGFDLIDGDKGRPARIQLPAKAHPHWGEALDVGTVIKAVGPMIEAFATRLLANAKFDRGATDRDDALSAEIPWARDDYRILGQYGDTIVAFTNAEFAQKTVTDHGLITPNFWDDKWKSIFQGATADEKLQHWLDDWHDSGPIGHGDH